MSENKRYWIGVEDANYENAVFCDEEFLCHTEVDDEKLVEELNRLAEENKQLKFDYETLKLQYDGLDLYRRELQKENKQLKQKLDGAKEMEG